MKVKSDLELGGLIVDTAKTPGIQEDLADLVHIKSTGSGMIYTILNEDIVIYGDPEQAREELYKRRLEILDVKSLRLSKVGINEKLGR